ncbi:GTPase, G3E family [Hathewaya proteolytica DSM 3090]|uniref:GTPase, G3E family n=1 Tax=Hathewaya proteolytica DSM 3090 TaxID=1121331 RepID=A0A1M6MBP1_9CLOT|nr:GTP-binding protein [Hathewaya proteolytica]SHJ80902.1 GTPase, G3E family [Hathewaya proteolytica DSM 3090]
MVKIHIVSGFLGAGKTTFIKRLMEILRNEKNVIIENEFGEVSIDGDVVKKEGYDVVELPSGCICCSLKLDFHEAIQNIIEDINPDNIIIEPTGLGTLSGIFEVLNFGDLKEKCLVENAITVIDGEGYFEQQEVFGEFFKDQIINAKTLFISKVDNISVEELNNIIDSLRQINSDANMIYESLDSLSADNLCLLLKGKTLEHQVMKDIYISSQKKAMEEVHDFQSMGISIKSEHSRNQLEKKLKSLNNSKLGIVYRAKGNVPCCDGSLEFNYVKGRLSITHSNLKSEGKVCIIGKNLKKFRINMIFQPREVKIYGK